MDLVHGLGRLDVPRRASSGSWGSASAERLCTWTRAFPRSWPGYEIAFRYHSARYEMSVENPHGATRGVSRVVVDGQEQPRDGRGIALADDGATHSIEVQLG